jgi:hypothetical protein
MDQALTDLIADAKRELRKRSGESTSDDQEAERRLAAIEAVEDWMFKTFRPHVLLALGAEVVWTGTEPLLQFTVDEQVFTLPKDGESYRLVQDGKTLTTIQADDQDFVSRVLVAVGGVVED